MVAVVAGILTASLAVSMVDGVPALAAPAHLRLGYSAVAIAWGGDSGNRLRLVRLPACVLTPPTAPKCQQQTELSATNAGGAVEAALTVSGTAAGSLAAAPMVVALAS